MSGVDEPDTGDALRDAAEVMRLVGEHCVWTQAMTHRSLVPYLIEEAAELVEAIEAGTPADVEEELGDLLWQVLFHADIAARDRAEHFDIDDVARALAEKMIHRHPHVFGEVIASTADEVRAVWTAAKTAEKRERTSVLDGVSDRMPTLALAQKMLSRTRAVLPPPATTAHPAAGPTDEAELGEALLALVATADENGWDADRALRERLRALEGEVRAREADRPDAAG